MTYLLLQNHALSAPWWRLMLVEVWQVSLLWIAIRNFSNVSAEVVPPTPFQTNIRYFSANSISVFVIAWISSKSESYWSGFNLIIANFVPNIKLYLNKNSVLFNTEFRVPCMQQYHAAALTCDILQQMMYLNNNIKVLL